MGRFPGCPSRRCRRDAWCGCPLPRRCHTGAHFTAPVVWGAQRAAPNFGGQRQLLQLAWAVADEVLCHTQRDGPTPLHSPMPCKGCRFATQPGQPALEQHPHCRMALSHRRSGNVIAAKRGMLPPIEFVPDCFTVLATRASINTNQRAAAVVFGSVQEDPVSDLIDWVCHPTPTTSAMEHKVVADYSNVATDKDSNVKVCEYHCFTVCVTVDNPPLRRHCSHRVTHPPPRTRRRCFPPLSCRL